MQPINEIPSDARAIDVDRTRWILAMRDERASNAA